MAKYLVAGAFAIACVRAIEEVAATAVREQLSNVTSEKYDALE